LSIVAASVVARSGVVPRAETASRHATERSRTSAVSGAERVEITPECLRGTGDAKAFGVDRTDCRGYV
jgi:hypothetical protein